MMLLPDHSWQTFVGNILGILLFLVLSIVFIYVRSKVDRRKHVKSNLEGSPK
jgi:hypothetical protein